MMLEGDEEVVGSSYLFLDLFSGAVANINTRASDSGHAWTILAGMLALNGTGEAYGQFSENVASVVGLSAADGTIIWNINTGPSMTVTVGGAFRISNLNNLIFWDDYLGALRLFKKVSGGYVSITSSPAQFVANATYEVKVVLLDTSIKVYINGVLKINATDAFNKTVGGVGIRTSFTSSGTGARILDMAVTA